MPRRRGRAAAGPPPPPSASSPRAFDRDAFYDAFTAALARVLRLEAEETPWPDFAEGELDALAGHYASPEWNAFR